MAVSTIPQSREVQLEAQLEAMTRERNGYRASYNALIALLYNSKHYGARAAVIVATTQHAHKYHKTHPGHTGPVPIFLDDIAQTTQLDSKTVSRKLVELDERQLIKKTLKPFRTPEGRRDHLSVAIPHIRQGFAAAIQAIAAYRAPALPSKVKSTKADVSNTRPYCPEHPNAAVFEDRAYICATCQRVLRYFPPTIVYGGLTEDSPSVTKLSPQPTTNPIPIRPHARLPFDSDHSSLNNSAVIETGDE